MARIRIEEARLKSWEDVSVTLKMIGECQIAIEAIEADMNTKISDLKLNAAIKSRVYQDKIKRFELEIKQFSEENKPDIKGKTKFLDFGKIGFRESTKIALKSIQAVLNNLKARKMTDCIRIKEEVNKESLGKYPDDVIAAVGASKKTEDVFWYEVDREKLADVS